VLYGADSQKSPTRKLSESVQSEGVRVLSELLAEALRTRATTVIGVATEVFRRAANGIDFVARIREELGLNVHVVDQGMEALLGFRTAAAVSSVSTNELIMWDCGGASFQLVRSPDGIGKEMQMHLGRCGDSVANAMLLAIQGKQLSKEPTTNPVWPCEAHDLVAQLRAKLPQAPQWLLGSRGVVAIGGRNSMFFLLADMIYQGGVSGLEDEENTVDVDQEGCPRSAVMTVTAARLAIQSVAGDSEDRIRKQWCWRPNSDVASLVLPKLCLILASLESFGVRSFSWCRTVGNCPGVATMNIRTAQ